MVLLFLTFLLMISTVFLICANVNPLIKIATLLTESLLQKTSFYHIKNFKIDGMRSISCCSLPKVHLCCTGPDAESMLCELFIKRENIHNILLLIDRFCSLYPV
jgi:hypothetical protein